MSSIEKTQSDPQGAASRQASPCDPAAADEGDGFSGLIDRLRGGSDDAFADLVSMCSPRLMKVLRRRLRTGSRRTHDSDDFLQAVWKSFWEGDRHAEDFESLDDLMAYLARMAVNKVHYEQRRKCTTTAGRADASAVAIGGAVDPPDTSPTPSRFAMGREEWARFCDTRSDRRRRALELRAQGATFEEIGDTLGMHPNSVRRLVCDEIRRYQRASDNV